MAANKALFTVVCIARNEQGTLPRLIKSLEGKGVEVIVVDTGSVDDTIKIATDLKCQVWNAQGMFNGEVEQREARLINHFFTCPGEDIVKEGDRYFNFAAARNYAVNKSSTDWVLVVDCDEWLRALDVDAINAIIKAGHVNQINYHYVFSSTEDGRDNVFFQRCHLYDRHVFHWVGAVHELLTPKEGKTPLAIAVTPQIMTLVHTQNSFSDRGHYLTGLAIDLLRDPLHERNQFYFARELLGRGKTHSANKQLQIHVWSTAWNSERCESALLLGDMQSDIHSKEKWYFEATKIAPHRRAPWMRLARLYYPGSNPSPEQCIKALTYAGAAAHIPDDGYFANPRRDFGAAPWQIIYWALYWLGRREEAKRAWEQALLLEPSNPDTQNDRQFFA